VKVSREIIKQTSVNGKDKLPLLTVCIPTYNRVEKVESLVKSVLRCDSNLLEIAVLDNASTDATCSKLLMIDDHRLLIVRNNVNIGGILNCIQSLSLGSGRYLLFCADKDWIDFSVLDGFLQFLSSNLDLAAGRCELAVNTNFSARFFNPGFESIYNLGYQSNHPTGYFFSRLKIEALGLISKHSDVSKVGGFPFEFILGELCLLGHTAKIESQMCRTESREEAQKIVSFSYSGEADVFFAPQHRYKNFLAYLDHFLALKLDIADVNIFSRELILRMVVQVTWSYRNTLIDEKICSHYRIKPRKVGAFEMADNFIRYSANFVFKSKIKSLLWRLKIWVEGISITVERSFLKLLKEGANK
jgi:glycosyltransferase involved in cell wall biosynthesis